MWVAFVWLISKGKNIAEEIGCYFWDYKSHKVIKALWLLSWTLSLSPRSPFQESVQAYGEAQVVRSWELQPPVCRVVSPANNYMRELGGELSSSGVLRCVQLLLTLWLWSPEECRARGNQLNCACPTISGWWLLIHQQANKDIQANK